ncbi:hypothetical protein [Nocardia sp. NPDC048505]|uniref:hypothetical protein n=1 Tax=unclassified Nocardia TaxID=2637762 RepID=UPI0033F4FAD2
MANNGPFGIDPEDFERVLREVGGEFRDKLEQAGNYIDRGSLNALAGLLGQFTQQQPRPAEPKPEPPTTGETGSGVWAIYTLDADGTARVDQVFPNELEALRAHRDNTDSSRRVRFLPYGVPAGVLDAG